MSPLEKYPLRTGEKSQLVQAAVVSEGIMLVIAIAILIIIIGASTGDWGYAAMSGWAQSIGFAFGAGDSVAHVAPNITETVGIFDTATGFEKYATSFQIEATLASIGLGLGVSLLLVALLVAFDYVGRKRSAAYCNSIMEVRQGVTGELVRLPMATVIPVMILTGVCEELAFRYALMNGIILLLMLVLPTSAATVIGLLATTAVFWFAHEQYRDPYSSGIVVVGGLILGAAYLTTGWILVSMVAHAAYNVAEIAIEQLHIAKEPDYYGGKVPTSLLLDMAEQARKDHERDLDSLD